MNYTVVKIPNLKFKDNRVYFVSKYPIKIVYKGKVEYKNELPIDVNLNDYIRVDGENIHYSIQKETLEDFVKIHIYSSVYNCQKYTKFIHSTILGIPIDEPKLNDIYENDSIKEYDNYEYNNNYSYKDNVNNNKYSYHDDYDNNYDNNDYNNNDYYDEDYEDPFN